MRVLAISSQDSMSRRRWEKVTHQLALGPDAKLELLMVRPPKKRLEVARLDVVEPSLLPLCPVVPVQGRAVKTFSPTRARIVRALRAGRQVWAAAPLPATMRRSNKDFLIRAAVHSKELRRRARNTQVIVSLDDDAVAPVAILGEHAPKAILVHGARYVRQTLEAHEIPLPPLASAPDAGDIGSAPGSGTAHDDRTLAPLTDDAAARLLIAPANYAGQAHLWAQAVRDHVSGATAENLRAGELKNQFTTDMLVDRETFDTDLDWRSAWRQKVRRDYTHVIVEANLPILGSSVGPGVHHARELQRAGKQVALLSHGSDARVPSIHAARERWHSYDALTPQQLEAFERSASANVLDYAAFDGSVFVSTPGLLEFVPDGQWLPLVIDPKLWKGERPFLAGPVPVVAHIPSSAQKGSHLIDPILASMAERGLIEYLRLEGIQHTEMPAAYRSADFMVEQFGIADYSVAACEAMAAGCVVVSRVAQGVRDVVHKVTGHDLPIQEANPETLESVILQLASSPDRCADIRQRSSAFVEENHDGRLSATVLQNWFESGQEPTNDKP